MAALTSTGKKPTVAAIQYLTTNSPIGLDGTKGNISDNVPTEVNMNVRYFVPTGGYFDLWGKKGEQAVQHELLTFDAEGNLKDAYSLMSGPKIKYKKLEPSEFMEKYELNKGFNPELLKVVVDELLPYTSKENVERGKAKGVFAKETAYDIEDMVVKNDQGDIKPIMRIGDERSVELCVQTTNALLDITNEETIKEALKILEQKLEVKLSKMHGSKEILEMLEDQKNQLLEQVKNRSIKVTAQETLQYVPLTLEVFDYYANHMGRKSETSYEVKMKAYAEAIKNTKLQELIEKENLRPSSKTGGYFIGESPELGTMIHENNVLPLQNQYTIGLAGKPEMYKVLKDIEKLFFDNKKDSPSNKMPQSKADLTQENKVKFAELVGKLNKIMADLEFEKYATIPPWLKKKMIPQGGDENSKLIVPEEELFKFPGNKYIKFNALIGPEKRLVWDNDVIYDNTLTKTGKLKGISSLGFSLFNLRNLTPTSMLTIAKMETVYGEQEKGNKEEDSNKPKTIQKSMRQVPVALYHKDGVETPSFTGGDGVIYSSIPNSMATMLTIPLSRLKNAYEAENDDTKESVTVDVINEAAKKAAETVGKRIENDAIVLGKPNLEALQADLLKIEMADGSEKIDLIKRIIVDRKTESGEELMYSKIIEVALSEASMQLIGKKSLATFIARNPEVTKRLTLELRENMANDKIVENARFPEIDTDGLSKEEKKRVMTNGTKLYYRIIESMMIGRELLKNRIADGTQTDAYAKRKAQEMADAERENREVREVSPLLAEVFSKTGNFLNTLYGIMNFNAKGNADKPKSLKETMYGVENPSPLMKVEEVPKNGYIVKNIVPKSKEEIEAAFATLKEATETIKNEAKALIEEVRKVQVENAGANQGNKNASSLAGVMAMFGEDDKEAPVKTETTATENKEEASTPDQETEKPTKATTIETEISEEPKEEKKEIKESKQETEVDEPTAEEIAAAAMEEDIFSGEVVGGEGELSPDDIAAIFNDDIPEDEFNFGQGGIDGIDDEEILNAMKNPQ